MNSTIEERASLVYLKYSFCCESSRNFEIVSLPTLIPKCSCRFETDDDFNLNIFESIKIANEQRRQL